MRLLHVSDLHLGKRINEFPMIEDQKYIMEQILGIVQEYRADGVLLAGDIYDKPVPSVEAVQIFDSFLTKLAQRGILVFVISGNHDSAERLAFGARLMREKGIFISAVYDGASEPICLRDRYGEIYIHLLPFLKPAMVRHVFGEEEVSSYQDALRIAIGHMEVDRSKRNVLVAHQFVTGAVRCESEEVSVGGLDNVDAALFDAFDYAALGHIHSPQQVGRETVRYCGSPLKYSFSEAGQEKSVMLVELGGKGDVKLQRIPLIPLRDMRKIRGTYLEVTARSFYQGTNTEDYIQVTLTDEEDIPDGMQKLRIIYPNLMRLEYDNQRTRQAQELEVSGDAREKSELELFGEFYELQNNRPMGEGQRAFVQELIRSLKGEER